MGGKLKISPCFPSPLNYSVLESLSLELYQLLYHLYACILLDNHIQGILILKGA